MIETPKPQNDFICKLTSQVSTVTINFNYLANDNRSLNMPILKNPRLSTIYIIFINKYTSHLHSFSMYDVIDKFVTLAPVPTRPKCLLIFWNNTVWSDDELKKLLKHAWTNNFIDFTIWKISKINSVAIHYNPFTETFSSKNLLDTHEIFPDKLKNLNKYPISLPAYTLKPHIVAEKKINKTVNVRGMTYAYVKIIIEKLNFQPHFIIENDSNSDSKKN